MKRKAAFTQDLSDLLRKYDLDTYCDKNATLLAIEVVKTIENKARVSIHQVQKI